jgi:hypothetical protein
MLESARPAPTTALRSILALAFALLLCAALAARADAGAWGTPYDLSAAGARAEIVTVGADAAGDQFAAWQYKLGSEWVVQAATRPVGESWSAPVDVSALQGEEPRPSLAVNSAGEAVIGWSQSDGSHVLIEVARGDVANAWTTPEPISSSATNSYEPSVGIDAAGEAFAAWRQFLGSNYGAAVSFEEAGGWSAPEVLSNPSDSNESPTLAVSPGGDALVGWERSEAVEVSRRPAGGSWGPAAPLRSGGLGISRLELAINSSGEAVAIWENAAAAGFSHWVVEAARMAPNGSWGSAEALTSSADFSRDPSITLSDSGVAQAAWQFSAGGPGPTLIRTEERGGAGTWSTPTDFATPDEAFEPQIAIDALGNTTMAWWGYDGTTHQYFAVAARRLAGGGWGPELALSEPGEEIYYPALAVDGTGGAVVAWTFWNESTGEETVRTVGLDGARPAVPAGGGVTSAPTKTPSGPAPILCTAPSGAPTATTFTPVARPGKTVPGIRARITVSSPSRVSVAATIHYKQGGKSRSVDAGTYSMQVKDARNLKVPLPSSMRSTLPVGSTVTVSLRIAATRTTSGCAGSPNIATKKLRLKVVRILTAN